LCSETENADLVLGGLVHASELVAELILGDVGAAGVEDIAVGEERSAIFASGALKPIQQQREQNAIHTTSIPRLARSQQSALSHQNGRRVGHDLGGGKYRRVVGRGFLARGFAGKGFKRRGNRAHSHDHLLAAEQRVADELARAQSHGGVGVGHLGGLMAVSWLLRYLTISGREVRIGIFPCVVFFGRALHLGGSRKIPVRVGASPNLGVRLRPGF
jgi:hypothetical protein